MLVHTITGVANPPGCCGLLGDSLCRCGREWATLGIWHRAEKKTIRKCGTVVEISKRFHSILRQSGGKAAWRDRKNLGKSSFSGTS